MANILGWNHILPGIKRELQNQCFTAGCTVQYIQTLFRNRQWKNTCSLPPYTPYWQRAEVTATTEKLLLRDPVEVLWENYTKMTLQRPEFLPPPEITLWKG